MDLKDQALDGSVGKRSFTMTTFNDNSDEAKALRARHLASGRPRYSVSTFIGGGRTETWTNDRDEALAQHGVAAARPEVESVLTFDNYALDMIAMHFLSDGGTYEEIAADGDAAVEAMVGGRLAKTLDEEA
jgi:hypothetical protein